MVRRCAVQNCSSTDRKILCHRFPRKSHLAEVWQQRLDLAHISLSDLCQKTVVCTLHFTSNDYRNKQSKNLNMTAIPISTIRQTNKDSVNDDQDGSEFHLAIDPRAMNFEELPVNAANVELLHEESDKEERITAIESDRISLYDRSSEGKDIRTDQETDDDPDAYFQDDSNMNYDTGDFSFPDPCKDLPDFATSDFLLEPPEIMDRIPDSEAVQSNHHQAISVVDDQFLYIMEVPTQLEDDQQTSETVVLDSKKEDTSGGQVRVSIEDGQLVFQTSNPQSFGDYQLVSDTSPAFDFEIAQQLQDEMQQMTNDEDDLIPVVNATTTDGPTMLYQHQEQRVDDDDDVITDEMRLYNEMSKKSLVQLMVKANSKIRELEERLETIELAHSKVLGSLELFRNVLRP